MPRPDQHASPAAAPRAAPLPIDRCFDEAFADEMARLEAYNKHHYRPNTYMHKWWARRCGSTFRLILKHLVAEEDGRDYYAPGGLEGAVILDPMMGGGTTLHEALRMGANVVGVDIDPIPVLQARATLSPVPLADLEAAFADFSQVLRAELASLYETCCRECNEVAPLRFVLYGSRRTCACGPAVLVDSTVLRYEGNEPAVRLCPCCHAVVHEEESCECPPSPGTPPLVPKETSVCPTCGQAYVELSDVPFYARYTPLVVVGHCSQHGLFFASLSPGDRERLAAADARRPSMALGSDTAFAVDGGPKSRDLLSHNVSDYLDLFSSRQLLYLEQAMAVLPRFDPLIRLNLSLLVSTSLEFNSMLCGYKGARRGQRPGAIRHTFSYHAYSFPYTALENNMLFPQKSSGTLEKLFHDRVRRARRWAARPRERSLGPGGPRFVSIMGEREVGEEVASPQALQEGQRRFLLRQGSAATLDLPDDSVDHVVTDPPYYDSVQYSDLAAFFRVWLRRLLPDAAVWDYDLSGSAVDPEGNGSGQYTAVLSDIFGECRRVLRPGGRLIFTFHHWKPRGWAALTLALQRAGFRLVNRYVVHSENPISVHIANMQALTHDAILVLAAGDDGAARSWERPPAVGKEDSAQFCGDCATLLGWLLEQRLPEAKVAAAWRTALA